MAQPKASTLQQRFGFLDEDLKNPNHDQIMVWLDTNVETIIKLIHNYTINFETNTVETLRSRASSLVLETLQDLQKAKNPHPGTVKEINKLIEWRELKAPVKPSLDIKKVWEYPVCGHNNFMVGFVDMFVQVNFCDELYLQGVDESRPSYYDNLKEIRYSLFQRLGEYSLPEWGFGINPKYFYFEVKTQLPSLGELIRQVRMYQNFLHLPGEFYVVAPDDGYAKHLNQQGIGFIKYPEGNINSPEKR